PPYTFRRRQHHMTGARFPHSDIPGSTSGWRLPEAYRSLPRPSSAPDAKASTVCPTQLDHTKMLAPTMQISNNNPDNPPGNQGHQPPQPNHPPPGRQPRPDQASNPHGHHQQARHPTPHPANTLPTHRQTNQHTSQPVQPARSGKHPAERRHKAHGNHPLSTSPHPTDSTPHGRTTGETGNQHHGPVSSGPNSVHSSPHP